MPRPANHIDLSGQQFGLLLVMEAAPPRMWHCVCACGNHVEILTANLRQNRRTCSRTCVEKNSQKARFLAEQELHHGPAMKVAEDARALLVPALGEHIKALDKRNRSEFYDLLKHYINLAVGP